MGPTDVNLDQLLAVRPMWITATTTLPLHGSAIVVEGDIFQKTF